MNKSPVVSNHGIDSGHSSIAKHDRAKTQARVRKKRISSFWVKQFHTWHWMSSAICLVGMLLFAITGLTLNHAGSIGAAPETTTIEKTIPADLVAKIVSHPDRSDSNLPALENWADEEMGADISGRTAEATEGELYYALPQPGGDGWIAFDLDTGTATYEHTNRGWISWLNDLHKGRDTGTVWSWFIDIFAGACVIFCVTGFFLLQLHARHRAMTWPLVGAGFVIPAFLVIMFIHL